MNALAPPLHGDLASPRHTRRLILKAVRQEISFRGVKNFRLERVAARSGVAVRTVYRHFQDKDDLYQTVCLELINEICIEIQPLSLANMFPEDALLYHCILLCELFENPSYEALLGAIDQDVPRSVPIRNLYDRQIVDAINRPILEYVTKNSVCALPLCDPKSVVEQLWKLIAQLCADGGLKTGGDRRLDRLRKIAQDHIRQHFS
jgi:AcrR family transcriptional regulator